MAKLALISDNLLYLVLIVAAYSLFFPGLGISLQAWIMPILALMVLAISLTITLRDLNKAVRAPRLILTNLVFQFICLPLFGLFLGKAFFPGSGLATGQLLVASLPADVSAPLMVYLAGGDTALGTAMLVAAMAITPLTLPSLLLGLGRVKLLIPVSYLVFELFVVIVLPVAIGVFLGNRFPKSRQYEPVYSATASLCYAVLLLIVVSANAGNIIHLGIYALWVLLAQLLLNGGGYLLALLSRFLVKEKKEAIPFLFLTSTKEFGIATAAAAAMGLPKAMVIPAVFFAVVQMVTSPAVVKLIKRSPKTTEARGN